MLRTYILNSVSPDGLTGFITEIFFTFGSTKLLAWFIYLLSADKTIYNPTGFLTLTPTSTRAILAPSTLEPTRFGVEITFAYLTFH